jgi:hypothetical protein
VFESSGGLLAAAGTEITEKQIGIFRKWGIRELEVEGISSEALHNETMSHLDPEQIHKIEKKVESLFRHIDENDPFTKELKRICSTRLIARMNGGGAL